MRLILKNLLLSFYFKATINFFFKEVYFFFIVSNLRSVLVLEDCHNSKLSIMIFYQDVFLVVGDLFLKKLLLFVFILKLFIKIF